MKNNERYAPPSGGSGMMELARADTRPNSPEMLPYDDREMYELLCRQAARKLNKKSETRRLAESDGRTTTRETDISNQTAETAQEMAWTKFISYKKVTYEGMTGLLNRDPFFEELQSIREMAKSKETGGAFLFIDLNDLSVVNNRYGHEVADQLISMIGGKIQNTIRPNDLGCRYGGDEFVIYATGIINKDLARRAGELADRVFKKLSNLLIIEKNGVRQTIDATGLSFEQEGTKEYVLIESNDGGQIKCPILHKVSFSLGVRPVDNSELREPTEARVWIHEADEALYMVKRDPTEKAGLAIITSPGKCLIRKGYNLKKNRDFATVLKEQTIEKATPTDLDGKTIERKLGTLLDQCQDAEPDVYKKIFEAMEDLAHTINRQCPLRN